MRRTVLRWLLGLALLPAGVTAQAPNAASVSGGDGKLYVGTYAKTILVLDERTFAITDTIPVSVGIPIAMLLSSNRKHFYVMDPTFEHVEVIDIATRKSLDKFTLSSGRTKVRIRGLNVEPNEKFAVFLIKTATKETDRWVIGKPTLVRYDLTKKTVTDTIPWPKGEEREGAQMLFSPNGDLLYFFADEVLVFETKNLKQVDRWEMARALEEGMGRFNFGFPETVYEEPGFYTGMFRVADPVQNRTLMGVARVDLVRRAVDFYTLGPNEQVGFALAPGRKRAYGLKQQVGNYEIWTYDLENRRVLSKTPFRGRPRMGLDVSSNGSLLYIHTAGMTIDLFDTTTLR
ncbi:MAG TPA: hypothetical protein VJ717_06550, partial [Gemmatimonadaceae bacterium]|nr:hypothetical protein [Gemmatimonadaceae bacterium]